LRENWKKAGALWEDIKRYCESEPGVVGLFLGGSRGKNQATQFSDYDVYVITTEKDKKRILARFNRLKVQGFDFAVFSLPEFRKHALLGTDSEGYAYTYAHVKQVIDKTRGELERLLREKARIPKNKIRKYVEGYLDGYINQVYRSLKCDRDGMPECARLEAAKGIPLFLNVIFGMEGRITPYYKYLEWELENWPLKKFKARPKQLVKDLLKILDGDLRVQQKLLKRLEKACRKEGYGKVFDSWGESLEWMKKYKPKKIG